VWKIIKDSIGKDLTKIAVPVSFNEPISMLQKTAEMMDYQDLLVQAGKLNDPALRLIYVTVFNMSQYACTKGRLSKPFNPILGETYEYLDKNYKFIAEQVSHHPPISVCNAQGQGYQFWLNSNMKTSFWGASL